MLKLKPFAHYLIVLGLAALLTAVGQLGGGQIAWAEGTHFQTVPTRTPTPGPGGDEQPTGDDKGDSVPKISGQIIGAVEDLSTGNPGAGVTVRINDVGVKTDTQGKYSLSGLEAGEYIVTMALQDSAEPAQDPVAVTLDGKSSVTVNLAFYSVPPETGAVVTPVSPASVNADSPAVTDSDDGTSSDAPTGESGDSSQSEQATGQATDNSAPRLLPQSGGVTISVWLLLVGGLFCLLLGLKLNSIQKS